MNPISAQLKTGTLGELLVQLRLLQFDVQAAPPLKDSGNDLIAIKGRVMRAIQVKTVTGDCFDLRGLPELYHGVALVRLVGEDRILSLDQCQIFLLPTKAIEKNYYPLEELCENELNAQAIETFFAYAAIRLFGFLHGYHLDLTARRFDAGL